MALKLRGIFFSVKIIYLLEVMNDYSFFDYKLLKRLDV